MKKLLYILFCITLISCNSKTEEIKEEEVVMFSDNETIIYESDIYEVINAFLKDLEEAEKKGNYPEEERLLGEWLLLAPFIEIRPPYDLEELNEILTKNDSIFSEKDKKFIPKQIKSLKKFDLKQEFISDFKILPKDTRNDINEYSEEENIKFWEKIKMLHRISFPVFNSEKDIAMISFGTYSGYNSSHGCKLIYKKENGKWIWVKTFGIWIS